MNFCCAIANYAVRRRTSRTYAGEGPALHSSCRMHLQSASWHRPTLPHQNRSPRTASTGHSASASRRSCRCRARRWRRSAGIRATSSSLPEMRTSTIRASAWRWWEGCSKRRVSASASLASPTGTRPTPSGVWGSRTCFSASPRAIWIRWSTATPRIARYAPTTPIRRMPNPTGGVGASRR